MYIDPIIQSIDLRHIRKLLEENLLTMEQYNTMPIVHMILYASDLPKCIELPDASDANAYHLFFYMIARFYFLDNGTQEIPYYYPRKPTYLVEQALRHLPSRFFRITQKVGGVEYIHPPSCMWYKDRIEEEWIYSYIRDLYTPLWKDIDHRGERIFISRRSATVRTIQDEDELVAPLKERGFSTYELERMTFQDQIRLFRSASVVLGAHGAGLTWSIFCREQTKLCEITYMRRGHYNDIATKCNLQYFPYSMCGYLENETIVIDKEHFLEYLDRNVLME